MALELRPRQQLFIDRVLHALAEHGQTLAVAPTGAGKTVCLAAVIDAFPKARSLVLVHRDELVRQTVGTIAAVTGTEPATYARWARQWGRCTVAMVPTLARKQHLAAMPSVDLVIVDEAHHAVATSYRRILDHARELQHDVRVLGVTATPGRGDRRRLSAVWDNCADQITLGELVASGHLVAPRAYAIDLGLGAELRATARSGGEYDLDAAGAVLSPATARVVETWAERAGDRQTVMFCSSVTHAEVVLAALAGAGHSAVLVTGATPAPERAESFARLASGDARVLVNVAVATEGWDCPPVSCVCLLRPSSYPSTVTQMIGRGLRAHPGKSDCVVIDYGCSLEHLGGLEQLVDLRPQGVQPASAADGAVKTCPDCGASVPIRTRECPLCGYAWSADLADVVSIEEFTLRYVGDLLGSSPYVWVPINERTYAVSSIDAWCVAFADAAGRWHGVVAHEGRLELAARATTQAVALAACEDHMRRHGTPVGRRGRDWQAAPPTDKQLALLAGWGQTAPTRYEASLLISLRFARRDIRQLLLENAA